MDKEDFEECVGTITHDIDPSQDRTIRLSRVQIKKLLAIQNWYKSKDVEDLRVIYELDDEVLQRFILSGQGTYQAQTIHSPGIPSDVPATPAASIPHSCISHSSTSSIAQLFQQSIKKSVSNYTTKLKDDKYWFNYNQALRAQAKTHGIFNVLDPDYVPTTLDEQELFEAQNSLSSMYSRTPCTLSKARSMFD